MNDQERYETICKPEFQSIGSQFSGIRDEFGREFKDIKDSLRRIETILFVGNGSPSIKTSIEVHEQKLKGILWIGGVLLSAVIVAVIQLHFK